MAETRKQLKERLQAAGDWDEYVKMRTQLASEGMSAPQAREEALRRIESRPAAHAERSAPRDGTSPTQQREYVASPDDDAPRQLMDLRHVYLNPKKYDRTEAHDNARRFKDRDPKGFSAQLAALEKEHKATMAAERGRSGGDQEPDLSTEKCVELARGLIHDILAQQAEEDAELAKRPNAAEFAATLQKRLAATLEREKRLQDRIAELERGGAVGV